MSKEKLNKLSQNDLARIQNQRNKLELVTALAEKAIAEAKTADLEYKNIIQLIYLENGLDISCKIEEDGTIIWKEDVAEVSPKDVSEEKVA